MDLGLLKSFALYLPILAFAIWEVVRLGRDPELRDPEPRDRERPEASRESDDASDDASGEPGHPER